MTEKILSLSGASSANAQWQAINWHAVEHSVRRLQMRIAKAVKEGRHNKVKALQWLVTHSLQAKLLAVKRVTQSRGARTAGVDGKVCRTPKQKIQLARSLQRSSYKAQPLRRIYIPKASSTKELRPLSIPTIGDRAMQALYLLALAPITETIADKNSYGFRSERCTADAIGQCFRTLALQACAQYVLEGDIRKCFDRLSHKWLETHIPMDKRILKQWLTAGYMEKNVLYPTKEGAAQGGVISPTITVMALSGLEQAVKAAISSRDKVNVVSYADDFVVTGVSKEVLEQKVKPVITAFLKERGLELSETKTKITHINEGFDFLGFQIRKYNGKLLIKPSKKSIKVFLSEIRKAIRKSRGWKTRELISLLNPKIRGWANYYHHVVAKRTFSYVDDCIYRAIARWVKWRHPEKNATWWRENYFRCQGMRNWVFTATEKIGAEKRRFDLLKMTHMPIKRHIKIVAEANPYDLDWAEYFEQRKQQKLRANILLRNMLKSRAGYTVKQPSSRVGV